MIGCYHSHPDGAAEPSATRPRGAGEENFLWLIAALAQVMAGDAGGFRLSCGGFFADWIGPAGADLVTSS